MSSRPSSPLPSPLLPIGFLPLAILCPFSGWAMCPIFFPPHLLRCQVATEIGTLPSQSDLDFGMEEGGGRPATAEHFWPFAVECHWHSFGQEKLLANAKTTTSPSFSPNWRRARGMRSPCLPSRALPLSATILASSDLCTCLIRKGIKDRNREGIGQSVSFSGQMPCCNIALLSHPFMDSAVFICSRWINFFIFGTCPVQSFSPMLPSSPLPACYIFSEGFHRS